jgi:hypothetical protein
MFCCKYAGIARFIKGYEIFPNAFGRGFGWCFCETGKEALKYNIQRSKIEDENKLGY